MKKRKAVLYSFILSFCLSCGMIVGTNVVKAATSEDGFWEYEVDNGETTVCGYKGESETVEIPDKLGGYPVTSIGEGTFEGCGSLTSIVIPGGVASIGDDFDIIRLKLVQAA